VPRGQLVAHYQPIVNADGSPWGAEALIRWDRPGHGLVSPATFIPMAEMSGMIVELGRWMLDEVAAVLARWRLAPGFEQFNLSLNLSGQEALRSDLAKDVLAGLRRGGADPVRLTLELTENALLFDLPTVAGQLERLRDAGVTIAIDDFGTGYTSVAHLRSLPVDKLKIDRSLVQRGVENSADRALLEMVAAVARALQLTTVAEGVESDLHLGLIREVGCSMSQGYLFGAPMPLAELERWLGQRVGPGLFSKSRA
jgi:EAL domain-containing protein (putative c-di-GMP-specific phosphodiesterase class I)